MAPVQPPLGIEETDVGLELFTPGEGAAQVFDDILLLVGEAVRIRRVDGGPAAPEYDRL